MRAAPKQQTKFNITGHEKASKKLIYYSKVYTDYTAPECIYSIQFSKSCIRNSLGVESHFADH